jgi:hypothetical protein
MGSTKPTPLKRTITQSGQLWHHPDFLKLWVGESLSLFGSQVTSVALPLTAVLLLSATPAQMGLLNAAGYAPYLMLTVFVGLWIDRVRRRPIMIIANIGQALLIGVIPLLAVLKVLTIEYLIAITFLAGMLKVVLSPNAGRTRTVSRGKQQTLGKFIGCRDRRSRSGRTPGGAGKRAIRAADRCLLVCGCSGQHVLNP